MLLFINIGGGVRSVEDINKLLSCIQSFTNKVVSFKKFPITLLLLNDVRSGNK